MKFSRILLEMYVMHRKLDYSIDRMGKTMTARTPGQEIAVVPVSWKSRHLIDTALKVHELFGS
jgi:hypothetical protein